MNKSAKSIHSEARRGVVKALAVSIALSEAGVVSAQSSKSAARLISARRLILPTIDGASAIWGSVGRDTAGNIWVGITMDLERRSARAFKFDPNTSSWSQQGSVLEELIRVDPQTSVRSQMKIHSRFVTGADGHLYFASADEQGESESTLKLPQFGGMLWRINSKTNKWERLFASKEPLVAISGGGRYIFALGYWGYRLYRYDTATGAVLNKLIASYGAHVTRNFFADARGHAFVPRLRAGSAGKPVGELVEIDANFTEIAATPISGYLGTENPTENHGMIALHSGSQGRSFFVTHSGRLYEVRANANRASDVVDLGFLHPSGSKYCPALFEYDQGRRLASVAYVDGGFEWVTFDLATKKSTASPLFVPSLKGALLFGSMALDNRGRAYLVGWETAPSGVGQQPLVLQVDFAG
jgi:hypothetical protein